MPVVLLRNIKVLYSDINIIIEPILLLKRVKRKQAVKKNLLNTS